MLEINATIDIDAPPERVWAQLTDFSAHAAWNPFIRKLAGVARVGERLAITVQPPGGKAMSFKPTVLKADPNSELRWRRVCSRGRFSRGRACRHRRQTAADGARRRR